MNKNQKSFVFAVAGLLCLSVASFAADGKAVYDQKCGSCHGKDGKGNAAMVNVFKVEKSALDLTDKATTDKSEADLIAITNKGVGKMPAYESKLSADEVAASVAYSRSLAGGASSSEAVPAAKADAGAGAGLFQGKCASCHGKDGKGNPAMANVFKVEKSALDLTDAATQAKSTGDLVSITKKGAGKMPAYEGKMKDDEINSLAGYIKSLGGK